MSIWKIMGIGCLVALTIGLTLGVIQHFTGTGPNPGFAVGAGTGIVMALLLAKRAKEEKKK